MSENRIEELFGKDKLLVRAMDAPVLAKRDFGLVYDFSIWAEEIEQMKKGMFTSGSSTLLVKGEVVPTYKNMGFLIDGEKAEAFHIAESDSGSNGDIADGTFVANHTDLNSLAELAQRVRSKHSKIMNEVNINIKDSSAVLGLFVNKAKSEAPQAHILMAQEFLIIQTGKRLPIYVYDSKAGELTEYNPLKKERESLVARLNESRRFHSANLGYWLESEKEGCYKNYFDLIAKSEIQRDNYVVLHKMQNNSGR